MEIRSETCMLRAGRPGRLKSRHRPWPGNFHTAHPHTRSHIRLTLLTQIDIFWGKKISVNIESLSSKMRRARSRSTIDRMRSFPKKTFFAEQISVTHLVNAFKKYSLIRFSPKSLDYVKKTFFSTNKFLASHLVHA